ncbi:hypothetical protein ACFL5Q_07960 [Planctomycetota bacterium]
MGARRVLTGFVLAAVVGLLVIVERDSLAIGAEAPAEDDNPFTLEPVPAAADPAPKKKDAAADDPFGAGPPATTRPDTQAEKGKPTPRVRPLIGSKLRSGEKVILEALEEPSEAVFFETPLNEVVEYLADLHEINVVVDETGLVEVGVSDDTPIELNIAKIPLRSVLGLILEPLELNWTIREGVLVITSEAEAERELVTKVYDVADLIVFRDEKDELWEDYDALVDAIVSTIAPRAWGSAGVGGPGSIEGATFGTAKVLVVRQNFQVHHRIAQLLEDLRGIAEKSPGDGKPPLKRRIPPPGYGGGMGGMRGMGGMGGGGMY